MDTIQAKKTIAPLSLHRRKKNTKNARQPLRQRIPLRWRKILKYSLYHMTKVFLFGGFVLFALVQCAKAGYLPGTGPSQAMLFTVVGLFVITCAACYKALYQVLHFLTYYYDIDDGYLIIRKGVLAQREALLPLSKITDVWVDRDVADVALGLYDVHISTPTHESGMFAHISGVDRRGAARLRKLIIQKVNNASLAN